MIWQNGDLKNPLSGKPLVRDTAHSFSDGAVRFPAIDEIPFLRVGRQELAREALRALDLEDKRTALILLLQDRDDWARNQPPNAEDFQPLFENKDLTLREAMRCLQYGVVGDYFAYRWSDPTFLSGLALLERHLPKNAQLVSEICCGIGHYLRELTLRGFFAVGMDVVFSKLWLARRFVAPQAKLVCADANLAFPFIDEFADVSFCHDAFYFLTEKRSVVRELKRFSNGSVLIGHAHNAEADNFSGGAAVSVTEYASLFDDSILYDDAELTRALLENRQPEPQTIEQLQQTAAICIVSSKNEIGQNRASFKLPPDGQSLRLNPLLIDECESSIRTAPLYPSQRYADEYAALSSYLILQNDEAISASDLQKAANGEWANDEKLTNLARRRVLLDLPEKW